MNVPQILREALDLTGLKQAQFAGRIGVSQGTISKWMAEAVSPNKKQWDDVTRFLAKNQRTRHLVSAETEILRYVPLLSLVSAGRLTDRQSQIPVEDVPLLAFADLGRGEFFALRVEGDSMDRLSPDGSTIVVNRADRELVGGRCYVFMHRGETTFKRWHPDPARLAPFSTNPVHEPVFIKRQKDFDVVGRVRRTVLDL